MIEVGEYVRFEDGKIEMVTYQLKKFIDEHISKSENNRVEFLGNIKHSKNIIDLIEEGDYVNGQLIEKIHRKEKDRIYYEFLENKDGSYEVMEMCELKNIYSILTKEQYEANCYKVKEE